MTPIPEGRYRKLLDVLGQSSHCTGISFWAESFGGMAYRWVLLVHDFTWRSTDHLLQVKFRDVHLLEQAMPTDSTAAQPERSTTCGGEVHINITIDLFGIFWEEKVDVALDPSLACL